MELGFKMAEKISMHNGVWRVDAENMHYKELNKLLRLLNSKGVEHVELDNVYGQRYIGTGLRKPMRIDVHGTPGNDLGAFMDGQLITVYGNAQDCTGNTMNDGQIVVHGRAGDVTGYGMRGGKIFICGDVGYRVGIHMKEYGNKKPILVVGGTAGDFLGEYMAGGVLLVLGLNLKPKEKHQAKYVGTGMHGGVIYICGNVTHLGKEVKVMGTTKRDMAVIEKLAKEFCGHFNLDVEQVMAREYLKIVPVSHRPYGKLYAY